MSLSRLFEIYRQELRRNLFRPTLWILLGIVFLIAWGLAEGNVRIGTGDSTVGGTKAWITSEFALAQILSTVDFLIFIFFRQVVYFYVNRDIWGCFFIRKLSNYLSGFFFKLQKFCT